MVNFKELKSRIKEFLRFDKQELTGLIPAILVTALIFSFRDWGVEQFNLIVGLKNFFLVVIIATLSFLFRFSAQKVYALSQGYKTDFKIWWAGLLIALVIAFLSVGRIPLIIIGATISAFMVKQRLGEFRYGHSVIQDAIIAFWGILGNLIMATFFAIGLYTFPESYFFSKGLWLNLIMAACSLIPLPQLDGLQIYFGSRNLFFMSILAVLVIGVLLLTQTKIGLITTIIAGTIVTIIYMLIGSEV